MNLSDANGVYDPRAVVAVTKGSVPNPAANAGHTEPTAVLHLASGGSHNTLLPFRAVAQWFAKEFDALTGDVRRPALVGQQGDKTE